MTHAETTPNSGAGNLGQRRAIKKYQRMLRELQRDPDLVRFHAYGGKRKLPALYAREYRNLLGRFADLLSPAERALVDTWYGDVHRHGVAVLLKSVPYLGYVPDGLWQVPEAVLEHRATCVFDGRIRSRGDRGGGHPLADASLARVDPVEQDKRVEAAERRLPDDARELHAGPVRGRHPAEDLQHAPVRRHRDAARGIRTNQWRQPGGAGASTPR